MNSKNFYELHTQIFVCDRQEKFLKNLKYVLGFEERKNQTPIIIQSDQKKGEMVNKNEGEPNLCLQYNHQNRLNIIDGQTAVDLVSLLIIVESGFGYG